MPVLLAPREGLFQLTGKELVNARHHLSREIALKAQRLGSGQDILGAGGKPNDHRSKPKPTRARQRFHTTEKVVMLNHGVQRKLTDAGGGPQSDETSSCRSRSGHGGGKRSTMSKNSNPAIT